MQNDVAATKASVIWTKMLTRSASSYGTALLRLMNDDSGQALVEYCVVMATLTILMMLAFRNVGTIANNTAGNNVNGLTNSSVVVP